MARRWSRSAMMLIQLWSHLLAVSPVPTRTTLESSAASLAFDVAFPSSLHMRVGCLVQRLMATTLMTNDQRDLKERRDASSGTPPRASLRHARRPWGPQYCAVYNRLVLPDVEMPQGPLASATGATAPVAGRAHHLPGPPSMRPSHAGCPAPIDAS